MKKCLRCGGKIKMQSGGFLPPKNPNWNWYSPEQDNPDYTWGGGENPQEINPFYIPDTGKKVQNLPSLQLTQPERKSRNIFPVRNYMDTGLNLLSEISGRVERNRQNDYMYDQLSNLNQMNAMPYKDFQPNPFSMYARYGGSLKKYQKGGKATTADSLAVYNQNNKVLDFYRKNGYSEELYNNNFNASLNDYKYGRDQPLEEVKVVKNGKIFDYSTQKYTQYKDINSNQFYTRESAVDPVNLDAPMQLVDKRIKSNKQIGFVRSFPTYSKTSGFSDTFRDQANILYYDPILIKPVSMLTAQERKERLKKYGKESGLIPTEKPNSIGDIMNRQKLLNKRLLQPQQQNTKEEIIIPEDQVLNTPVKQSPVISNTSKYSDLGVRPLYDGNNSLLGTPVLLQDGRVQLKDNSGNLIGNPIDRNILNQYGNSSVGNNKLQSEFFKDEISKKIGNMTFKKGGMLRKKSKYG